MANDSIYDIPKHITSRTYVKNAVVFVQELVEGTNGVPKNIKYYYALQNVPSSTAITALTIGEGSLVQYLVLI